jgi:hypothetical protein
MRTKAQILEYKRGWYAENLERMHRVQADWRSKNKEKILGYAKKYREKNKAKYHNYHLVKKYGLTSADRDALLQSQNNGCAVCGSISPRNKYGWQVDHCHRTGKVRGVLCHGCNLALGGARESKTILEQLIKYLEKHG